MVIETTSSINVKALQFFILETEISEENNVFIMKKYKGNY